METLDARQAATLLHMNERHLRRLARAGKLPGRRVGRRWLFARQDLERLLGATPNRPAPGATLSARNALRGRVIGLRVDGLMAEVRLGIGDQELVSIITRASAERMGLEVGDPAHAVIKATEIMIGKD